MILPIIIYTECLTNDIIKNNQVLFFFFLSYIYIYIAHRVKTTDIHNSIQFDLIKKIEDFIYRDYPASNLHSVYNENNEKHPINNKYYFEFVNFNRDPNQFNVLLILFLTGNHILNCFKLSSYELFSLFSFTTFDKL